MSCASLPLAVQAHLGSQLQAAYAVLTAAKLPQRFLDLIAQLDIALAGKDGPTSGGFRQDLLAALPGLRAFALSLVTDAVRADDLVQETVLKAWSNQNRFEPGSNLKAWLCTILRNQFYTEIRKRKREVEDVDGVAAAQMVAPAGQEHAVDLHVIQREMAKLPVAQREALLLVGAQGMTYEAAAEVIGCQVGTVKSRVSRARAQLAGSLGSSARGH
jgi:RNA polymerase sigma factor (sigma-70 family)